MCFDTGWHGENNWVGKALNAPQQGQDLQMPGWGSVAKKLFGWMMRIASRDLEHNFFAQPKPGSVRANEDIALGLMAAIKYGAIGGTILSALGKGYQVTGQFDAGGALPFDDELTISFEKH